MSTDTDEEDCRIAVVRADAAAARADAAAVAVAARADAAVARAELANKVSQKKRRLSKKEKDRRHAKKKKERRRQKDEADRQRDEADRQKDEADGRSRSRSPRPRSRSPHPRSRSRSRSPPRSPVPPRPPPPPELTDFHPRVRYLIVRNDEKPHNHGGERFHTKVLHIRSQYPPTDDEILQEARLYAVRLMESDEYRDIEVAFEDPEIVEHGVAIVRRGNMNSHPMTGGPHFVGDDSVPEETGHCLIDALLHRIAEVRKEDKYRHVAADLGSADNMTNFFRDNVPGWTIKKPLTIDHVILWAKSEYVRSRVSLYCVSVDDRLFNKYVGGDERERARVVIGIRVVDSHATLIHGMNGKLAQCIKGFVNTTSDWPDDVGNYSRIEVTGQRPQLSDLVHIIVGGGYIPHGRLSDSSQFESMGGPPELAGGLFIHSPDEDCDLAEVGKDLISRLASSMNCHFPLKWGTRGLIVSAKIRDKFFLYFSADDQHVKASVLSLCATKLDNVPVRLVLDRNQSLTAVAVDYFSSRLGDVPTSVMNERTYSIFSSSKYGGLRSRAELAAGSYVKVDTTKAYSGAMMKNPFLFCLFDLRNDFVSFAYDDKPLAPGFYCLSEPFSVHGLFIDEVVYPYFAVQFLLDKKMIDPSIIVSAIFCNNTLPADFFKAATEELYINFGDEHAAYAKPLPNLYVGSLGTHVKRAVHGGMTTDIELAALLHGQATDLEGHGEIVPMCEDVGGVFYVHYSTATPVHANNMSFWIHILWLNKLDEIMKAAAFVDAGLAIVGWNTDELLVKTTDVSVVHAIADVHNAAIGHVVCGVGTWKVELGGRSVKALIKIKDPRPVKARAILNHPLVWQDCNESDFGGELRSALVVGGPGCGKSTLLATLLAANLSGRLGGFVLCSASNPVHELIVHKGIDAGRVNTFDYFLEIANHSAIKAAKLIYDKYSTILVDEFSQLSKVHLQVLFWIKLKRPDTSFVLFGDADQCRPVAENNDSEYNYRHCDVVKWLCGCHLIELPYRVGAARFDERLQIVVNKFKDEHVLPYDSVQHVRKWQYPDFTMHIVATNKQKRELDGMCQERFIAGKTLLHTVEAPHSAGFEWRQNMKIVAGLPLMCRENMKAPAPNVKGEPKDIKNAQRFIVVSFESSKVVIRRISDDAQFVVTDKELASNFDLNFAITANRAQSITIRVPYVIHLQYCMTAEALYVAMSRGTKFTDVFFNDYRLKEPLLPRPYTVLSLPFPFRGPSLFVMYSVKAVALDVADRRLEYRGLSEIKDDRTAQAQADHRMTQHVKANKTRFEKTLTAIGHDKFEVTVLHVAMYSSEFSARKDETYFINQVDPDLLLNDRQVDRQAEQREGAREKITVQPGVDDTMSLDANPALGILRVHDDRGEERVVVRLPSIEGKHVYAKYRYLKKGKDVAIRKVVQFVLKNGLSVIDYPGDDVYAYFSNQFDTSLAIKRARDQFAEHIADLMREQASYASDDYRDDSAVELARETLANWAREQADWEREQNDLRREMQEAYEEHELWDDDEDDFDIVPLGPREGRRLETDEKYEKDEKDGESECREPPPKRFKPMALAPPATEKKKSKGKKSKIPTPSSADRVRATNSVRAEAGLPLLPVQRSITFHAQGPE